MVSYGEEWTLLVFIFMCHFAGTAVVTAILTRLRGKSAISPLMLTRFAAKLP